MVEHSSSHSARRLKSAPTDQLSTSDTAQLVSSTGFQVSQVSIVQMMIVALETTRV